jgi:hypothetical protein
MDVRVGTVHIMLRQCIGQVSGIRHVVPASNGSELICIALYQMKPATQPDTKSRPRCR